MTLGSCSPWIPDEELPAVEKKLAGQSEELMRCNEEFLLTLIAIREKGATDVEILWNAAFHINIVYHDILVLFHCMATSKGIWARRAIGRSLATVIYEGCEDVLQLFGKDYIKACETLGIWKEVETAFRETKKQLSVFWATHQASLKTLRVTAGAHKDHDTIYLLKTIAEFPLESLLDQAHEMQNVMRGFGAFSHKCMGAADQACRERGIIP